MVLRLKTLDAKHSYHFTAIDLVLDILLISANHKTEDLRATHFIKMDRRLNVVALNPQGSERPTNL
jgi:hypothetical protein